MFESYFVTLDRLFKTKKKKFSKITEKLEKIHMYIEKLTNQFWQKKIGYRFFFLKIFFSLISS